MWLVPIAYLSIGVFFVFIRRSQGASIFDVFFAVMFWPMHAAFVDDADRVMPLETRFIRFRASLERVRCESERLASAIAAQDSVALEHRLTTLTDRASAQTLAQHLRDLHRARDEHTALLVRIDRIAELDRTLALRFELAQVLPRQDSTELELLLADAETELDAI